MDKKVTTVQPLPSRRVPLNVGQFVRLVVVGIFVAGLFTRTLPDAMRIVQPLGVFGYYTDGSGRVSAIAKNSGAARAGLRVGDRIRVDLIPLEDRKPGLVHTSFSWYNWTRHVQVQRGRKTFLMTMQANPEAPIGRVIVAIRTLAAIAIVAIGSLLVIVRPSLATWGFFVFCIGGGHQSTYLDTILPYPWRPIENGIADVINSGANIGLLVFALLYVNQTRLRFRVAIGAGAIAVWVVGAALATYGDLALTYGGKETAAIVRAAHYVQDTIIGASILSFLYTFVRSRGETRQRIGWIVVAFVISMGARVAGDALFPQHLNGPLYSLMLSLQILPALAVASGVIHKRILDVDFVVSQALVYVALIGALVGVFVVVDEGLSYYFVMNTDFAYAIILVVCFLSSLVLGRARDIISGVVDRVFFRERQATREQLGHISRTLPLCSDRELVDRFLVDDVCATLDLQSAAMFERDDDGGFDRRRAIGWPADMKPRMEADDPLVREIEHSWDSVDLDSGEWSEFVHYLHGVNPVLVLPIIVAHRLEVLLIYGAHASGVTLDPDEVRLVTAAAASAAVALSNLKMAELEAQIEELERMRAENENLRAQLGTT